MTQKKLYKNKVRCLRCGTVIESKYRHDYRECGCDAHTMVDGGIAALTGYIRRGGGPFEDIVEEIKPEEYALYGIRPAEGDDSIRRVGTMVEEETDVDGSST